LVCRDYQEQQQELVLQQPDPQHELAPGRGMENSLAERATSP
jgi:hypothetical protein